jgi:hypothetical protein
MVASVARKPQSYGPHVPPAWEIPDAGAIQALARGDASSDQQRRAIEFIVNSLCGTYDLSYRPESERATCFAEGRRFVGTQIVKLTKINLSKMRQAHGGQPDEHQ